MSTKTNYVQTKLDNIFNVLSSDEEKVDQTKEKSKKSEQLWEKYYNEYVNSDMYIKKGTKWGDVE